MMFRQVCQNYLKLERYPINLVDIVQEGSLNILENFYEFISDSKFMSSGRICEYASQWGHLGILQQAIENGCRWGFTTCANAASGGHLDVLKWAREHECSWDSNTCTHAAEGGYLEVLQWARANGCP